VSACAGGVAQLEERSFNCHLNEGSHLRKVSMEDSTIEVSVYAVCVDPLPIETGVPRTSFLHTNFAPAIDLVDMALS